MSTNEAYAKYTQFPQYSYDITKYLLEHNELIWKLLKYETPDAWEQDDLTHSEKAALIYGGQDNLTDYRVFFDPGQPNSWTHESCIIRIYPYSLIGANRTTGTCTIMLEAYSHYKINHLSNYTTRIDTITQQLLETLNGIDIGLGIGKLFFDTLASRDDAVRGSGQAPFRGKMILMSNRLI